jgi:hypothetical protein
MAWLHLGSDFYFRVKNSNFFQKKVQVFRFFFFEFETRTFTSFSEKNKKNNGAVRFGLRFLGLGQKFKLFFHFYRYYRYRYWIWTGTRKKNSWRAPYCYTRSRECGFTVFLLNAVARDHLRSLFGTCWNTLKYVEIRWNTLKYTVPWDDRSETNITRTGVTRQRTRAIFFRVPVLIPLGYR